MKGCSCLTAADVVARVSADRAAVGENGKRKTQRKRHLRPSFESWHGDNRELGINILGPRNQVL